MSGKTSSPLPYDSTLLKEIVDERQGDIGVADLEGECLDKTHAVSRPIGDVGDKLVVGIPDICLLQNLQRMLAEGVGLNLCHPSLHSQQGGSTTNNTVGKLSATEEGGIGGDKGVEIHHSLAMEVGDAPIGGTDDPTEVGGGMEKGDEREHVRLTIKN